MTVSAYGRSEDSARRAGLAVDWVFADVTQLSVQDWTSALAPIDVVVNASGALQTGAKDDLSAIHVATVSRLCRAMEDTGKRLIQISAAGVSVDAATSFFKTKAQGDAIVRASDLDWVILRPSLVIGPNAYGGTALLRGVAGFPWVSARVFADAPIQTISLQELGAAVADCITGQVPMCRDYDLTAPDVQRFDEVVSEIRSWLGFSPPKLSVPVPGVVLGFVRRISDMLGWLGWRPPLRTAAMQTLAQGITADPTAWRIAGGREFSSLQDTLSAMPSTLQERWFSRLYLMFPATIALLSLFWLVSGLIGFWQFGAATEALTSRGFNSIAAQRLVAGGGCADIALGAAILYRPWSRVACLGMVATAFGYMIGAALFAPDLWADPLGPMVKVLPSVGLACLAYAMLEDR
jgi:uncharacterized protein YbjT (DUF2867 family)